MHYLGIAARVSRIAHPPEAHRAGLYFKDFSFNIVTCDIAAAAAAAMPWNAKAQLGLFFYNPQHQINRCELLAAI